MAYRVLFVSISAIVLMFMASCSSSDESAVVLPPLTLPSPPTPVFVGECDDTPTLEAWLQTIQFQQRDFSTLMDEARSQSEQALYLSVEQLALLQIRISEEPAPDCGVDLHQSILGIMNEVVQSLQTYVNTDTGNLDEIVDNAQLAFNGLLPQQSELLNRLETQYQN